MGHVRYDWGRVLSTHSLDENNAVKSVDGVPCSPDMQRDVCSLAFEECGIQVGLEGVGGQTVDDGEAAWGV